MFNMLCEQSGNGCRPIRCLLCFMPRNIVMIATKVIKLQAQDDATIMENTLLNALKCSVYTLVVNKHNQCEYTNVHVSNCN